MELSICLTKYAGESDPYPFFDSFIEGYGSEASLTDEEITSVPHLMKLRILSNVVYFVGRAISGEDTIEQLTDRAGGYAKRCTWINSNGDRLIESLRAHLGKKKEL